jgi:membrane dipeptidase
MMDPNLTVDRRTFALGLAATATLGGASAPALAAGPAAGGVRSLYDKSIVIDALASPNTFNVPYPPVTLLNQAQLDHARASGITAVNQTVSDLDFKETVRKVATWLGEIERHPDYFRLVQSRADIVAAKREKKMGIILGFQGLDMIGADLSLIGMFRDLGVRIMQLTYNRSNALGAGSSEPDNRGLTDFGRQAVERLNALNILVDVSHANPRTMIDAAAASKTPIAITHTGCRAVYDHQRSSTDEALRAVAGKGGVVGIYLMPFLGQDPKSASRALFARHLQHALKVCGEDHVGIGSDQSTTPVDISPEYMKFVGAINAQRTAAGIAAPLEADGPVTVPELNAARRIELIASDLAKAGYPARVVEKVIGGNFYRLFGEIWGA